MITHWYIKVGGSDLSEELSDALISGEVDDSLDLPDMFTLQVRDPKLRWVDGSLFALGSALEVAVKTPGGSAKLMSGEITGLEPNFPRDAAPYLVVRGYDQSHRLHHGRKTRSFTGKCDSDIVKAIAREYSGMGTKVDPTSQVHEWVLQNNQTDYELVQERARRLGYRFFVEDNNLHFVRAPEEAPRPVPLEWGVQLLDFRARLVTTEQVKRVVVRGWDPERKKEIVGDAATPQNLPRLGQDTQGGKAAQQAYGNAGELVVVDRFVATPSEAAALAQALCDEVGGAYLQAEGTCLGNPKVLAGATVELSGLGTKFSGQYLVTHSTHRYDAERYTTSFSVSGLRGTSLTQLLRGRCDATSRPGVVIGVVTNNRDPKGWGRVKVRYPWQDDKIESDWARLVSPMAGAGRGFEFLPEINDEVLVAFEHGDMHRPYVLGALWNGVDAPPEPSNGVLDGQGRVNKRIIKSRAGHQVILDDTNDVGGITVVDKTGSNKIVIDAQRNKLIIEAQGDVEIKSSAGKVTIDGATGVTVKGARIDLN